jgi:chromosomal replication initiator protein
MTRDHQAAMAKFFEAVRARIGDERLALWFLGFEHWEVGSEEVVVSVPHPFLAECVQGFCRKDLEACVVEALGDQRRLVIAAKDVPGSVPCDKAVESVAGLRRVDFCGEKADGVGGERQDWSPPHRLEEGISLDSSSVSVSAMESRLDSDYGGNVVARVAVGPGFARSPVGPRSMSSELWNGFLPGECNRVAHMAAQMVLESPGTMTPMTLHGPSGVGKSHLARAIAEQFRVRHRMSRVVCLTAEQFLIDFTDSVRGSGFANFRRKYREVDVLVMDDVQFLIGKNATLQELKSTLDHLFRNQKQVVLVVDRSLPELTALGAELLARLSSGVVCAIDLLDRDCRQAMVRKLASDLSVSLDQESIDWLATHCPGDARMIRGVILRLLTQQRITGRNLEMAEVMIACRDLLRVSQPLVRISDIDKAVCEVFGLEPNSLQSNSKSKQVSQPRMLAMFLARKYTRAAYAEIGDYFGKRQHSTVISAQKKVESWLESDSSLSLAKGRLTIREMIRSLESSLQVG